VTRRWHGREGTNLRFQRFSRVATQKLPKNYVDVKLRKRNANALSEEH
jgi:hypothetical protein